MKKTKIILTAIIVAIIVACVIHISVAYVNIAHDMQTSAPASVAFFLIIPYALAALIFAVALIIIHIKNRK